MKELKNVWGKYGFNEADINKIVIMLHDILGQLGKFGKVFDGCASEARTQFRDKGIDIKLIAEVVTPQLNRLKIVGRCAYRLAEGGLLLLEPLSWMVLTLKKEYQKIGVTQSFERFDEIGHIVDELEDAFNKTLSSMEHYKSGDAKKILEEICKRAKDK